MPFLVSGIHHPRLTIAVSGGIENIGMKKILSAKIYSQIQWTQQLH
jgi:hypothetical protein